MKTKNRKVKNNLRKASKKRLTFDERLDATFLKTALTAAEFGYVYAEHGHSWLETRVAIRKLYAK